MCNHYRRKADQIHIIRYYHIIKVLIIRYYLILKIVYFIIMFFVYLFTSFDSLDKFKFFFKVHLKSTDFEMYSYCIQGIY